ncbi:hypothetical protein E5288_WYG019886 [Bos mutus]|uniref:Uncharacterized protein n=1 Tax=Bos mutus TaxID=72004 RepID=A0A6B0RNA7_9CETA|nr:hypothetical protein [Bos mutus]
MVPIDYSVWKGRKERSSEPAERLLQDEDDEATGIGVCQEKLCFYSLGENEDAFVISKPQKKTKVIESERISSTSSQFQSLSSEHLSCYISGEHQPMKATVNKMRAAAGWGALQSSFSALPPHPENKATVPTVRFLAQIGGRRPRELVGEAGGFEIGREEFKRKQSFLVGTFADKKSQAPTILSFQKDATGEWKILNRNLSQTLYTLTFDIVS